MDLQQIADSAKAIASDSQAIDLRFQVSCDLRPLWLVGRQWSF